MRLMPGLLILFVLSCTPQAKPIEYGSDICHYCKMTIVDPQHAAQIVTQKGKVYSFDAIECMINYIDDYPNNHAIMSVCNYLEPKAFLEAEKSYYLISKNIPSPMGAFLSSFPDKESALQMQKEKDGEIYTWEEVQSKINNQ